MSGFASQVFENKYFLGMYAYQKRAGFVNYLCKICTHQWFAKSQYQNVEKKTVLFNLYALQSQKKRVNLAPF